MIGTIWQADGAFAEAVLFAPRLCLQSLVARPAGMGGLFDLSAVASPPMIDDVGGNVTIGLILWGLGIASILAAAALAVRAASARRKRLEQKLGAFTRDFKSFLDHTSDFMYFKDVDTRIIFCSQPLADVTGRKDWRDLQGKHNRDIFPPELAEIYEQEEVAVVAEGRPLINKINPYHDAAGQVRYVLTNKWPRFDDQGQVVGLFGISVDITERRRTEQRLAESEEKHRRLFETMASGVVVR